MKSREELNAIRAALTMLCDDLTDDERAVVFAGLGLLTVVDYNAAIALLDEAKRIIAGVSGTVDGSSGLGALAAQRAAADLQTLKVTINKLGSTMRLNKVYP